MKKVFVRSGIRFDYLLADKSREFLRELCEHHVSGQLKVAPEHVADPVLQRMKKMIKAFSHAVKNGPLLSFEVLCDTKEVDSFRRYAPHGGEILCVFNRSDKSYEIQRSDLLDADTGVYGNTVPPHECKLFWKD